MKIIKKGFTLLEMIVVLAILGILAGILIPTFIGIRDKANDKALTAECRNCVDIVAPLYTLSLAGDSVDLSYTAIEAQANVAGKIKSIIYDSTVLHLTYENNWGTVEFCRNGGCSQCGNTEMYTILRKGEQSATYQTLADRTFASVINVIKTNSACAADKTYLYGASGNKIDGVMVNSADPSYPHATNLYANLSDADKAFLKSVSWTLYNTKNGVRVYFTTTNYGDATVSGKVRLYKYDPDTGKYQYTDSGTVTKGKLVEGGGAKWSEWSDTIEK